MGLAPVPSFSGSREWHVLSGVLLGWGPNSSSVARFHGGSTDYGLHTVRSNPYGAVFSARSLSSRLRKACGFA